MRKWRPARLLMTAALLTGCLGAGGCGSGSATGGSDSGGTVNVTGTVTAPSTTSLSAGKAPLKSVTDAATADLTCTLYTFDGEQAGTGTTASDGSFTITSPVSTLRPAGATGSGWTEEVSCVCENADGSVHVENYAELTVAEGTTTSVSLGRIDSESTLAARAVLMKVGCNPLKESCTVPSGVDLQCLYKAEEAIWDQADRGGSGAADDAGYIRDAIRAAQAAGVKPKDLGYDNWGDCTRTLRDGTITATALSSIASAAAGSIGQSAGSIESALKAAPAMMEQIRSVVTDALAGKVGLTEITATSDIGIAPSVASSESPCAKLAADQEYAQTLVQMVLAPETAADMKAKYSVDEPWLMMAGVLDQATDKDYSKFKGEGRAIDIYVGALNGEYGKYVSGGVVKTDAVRIFGEVMRRIDSEALGREKTEDYSEGFAKMVQAGDVTTFYSGGQFVADKVDVAGTYFTSSSFDSATAGTGYYEQLQTVLVGGATYTATTDACAALTDYEAKRVCYGDAGYGGYTTTTPTSTIVFDLAGQWDRSHGPTCTGSPSPSLQPPSSITISGSGSDFSTTTVTSSLDAITYPYNSDKLQCRRTVTDVSLSVCAACVVDPTARTISFTCPVGIGMGCSVTYTKR